MNRPRMGRYTSISYFRRMVTDLMHFSMKVPSATVEREMHIVRLVEARRAMTPSPPWSAIFTKAFAVVASRTPALRTCLLTFPWSRFYEHPVNVATINIDRELAEERIVIYAHVESPENLGLQELDALIRHHQTEPVENIGAYRNAVRLSRVPWPFRRWFWWMALNIFGMTRCRHFGTFGITSVGSEGSGLTHIHPLLTSQLHYGIIDTAGKLAMRLSFDHRVLDGMIAAKALAEMEAVLMGEILDECRKAARD